MLGNSFVVDKVEGKMKTFIKMVLVVLLIISIWIGFILAGFAICGVVSAIRHHWNELTTLFVAGGLTLFALCLWLVYEHQRITWLEEEVKKGEKV